MSYDPRITRRIHEMYLMFCFRNSHAGSETGTSYTVAMLRFPHGLDQIKTNS
jgi:hypothetical protein